MDIFCGAGTPVLDEAYSLQDIVDCEATEHAPTSATMSPIGGHVTYMLSTSAVATTPSHLECSTSREGMPTITTYSLTSTMVTAKPLDDNILVTPSTAGGQVTCQASTSHSSRQTRALSPVSDDEARGSKRKFNTECPPPRKLSRTMGVDGRDVRSMIDDLSRTMAVNHQDVLHRVDALLPSVRETIDEASVLQQSYYRELFTNLDQSLVSLKATDRRHGAEENPTGHGFFGKGGGIECRPVRNNAKIKVK